MGYKGRLLECKNGDINIFGCQAPVFVLKEKKEKNHVTSWR